MNERFDTTFTPEVSQVIAQVRAQIDDIVSDSYLDELSDILRNLNDGYARREKAAISCQGPIDFDSEMPTDEDWEISMIYSSEGRLLDLTEIANMDPKIFTAQAERWVIFSFTSNSFVKGDFSSLSLELSHPQISSLRHAIFIYTLMLAYELALDYALRIYEPAVDRKPKVEPFYRFLRDVKQSAISYIKENTGTERLTDRSIEVALGKHLGLDYSFQVLLHQVIDYL